MVAMSLLAWKTKELGDYHVFHTAAVRVWDGGLLYLESDGDMPFKYAPVVAVLLAPLGLLPERVAVLLWLLATALALVRFVAWARQTWFPEAPLWATALAVVFIAPFHRHLLSLGQCDIFILALVMWSELLRRERMHASGAVLALACAFKPPFLLFVALALLFREWRRLAGFGAGVAAGVLLTVARYGISGTLQQLRAWQDTLARTTAPMFCALDNQSVFGLVCRHVAEQDSPMFRPVAYAAAALLFLLIVAPALRIKVTDDRRTFLLAAAFYLSASLSPLGWRTNLVGMLPLFFMLFAVTRRSGHKLRWLLVVPPAFNAFFGLLMFDLVGSAAYKRLVDLHTYGIVAAIAAVAIAWSSSATFTAREARST